MRRWFAAIGAVAIGALCSACDAGPPPLVTGPPIPAAGSPEVYAALGASETVGVGLGDTELRQRYAWPQLFFNSVLPRAATYYNFAAPGITTTDAMFAELPEALAVHPTVVTVFFNIDDLVNGVSPVTFGTNLDAIVHSLRQDGKATVLVGNAPAIDSLPALMVCQGAVIANVTCPVPPGVAIPGQAVIDTAVDAYDAAIAAVVAREGAVLVDVRAHSDQLTANPAALAPDGLHPSPLGNQMLALLFEAAYTSSRP